MDACIWGSKGMSWHLENVAFIHCTRLHLSLCSRYVFWSCISPGLPIRAAFPLPPPSFLGMVPVYWRRPGIVFDIEMPGSLCILLNYCILITILQIVHQYRCRSIKGWAPDGRRSKAQRSQGQAQSVPGERGPGARGQWSCRGNSSGGYGEAG